MSSKGMNSDFYANSVYKHNKQVADFLLEEIPSVGKPWLQFVEYMCDNTLYGTIKRDACDAINQSLDEFEGVNSHLPDARSSQSKLVR